MDCDPSLESDVVKFYVAKTFTFTHYFQFYFRLPNIKLNSQEYIKRM